MPAPTWTYTYDWTLAKDRIRRIIGDTDATDKKVYDEEIAYHITGGDSQDRDADLESAIAVAEDMANKFANMPQSLTAGGTSVNWGERASRFRQLVIDLRAKSNRTSSPRPFLGGQSISDKLAREADTDRVAPTFTRTRTDPYERSERYGDYS